MKRETIKINSPEGEFEFYTSPTIIEERHIKNGMVELLGGWDKYSSFMNSIAISLKKHNDSLKAKYGEEELAKKNEEILKLSLDKEKEKEFLELFNELHNDNSYQSYNNLLREHDLIYDYAFMSIMAKNKPKDFDFFNQTEATLKRLVILLRIQLEPKKKELKNSED